MVDPHHVINIKAVFKSFQPPGKTSLFMVVPVIEGVAPELSRSAEVVRGAARRGGLTAVFIQLEKFRIRPDIRTVGGYIDRNVSDDPDPLPVRVIFQLHPLFIKFKLQKTAETHTFLQTLPRRCQGFRIPESQRIFPLVPGPSSVLFLQSHEQSVVLKPFRLLRECPELLILFDPAVSVRLPEQLIAALVLQHVIHTARVGRKSGFAAVRLSDPSLFHQLLR